MALKAKYPGRCVSCGGHLKVGDLIEKTKLPPSERKARGEYEHDACSRPSASKATTSAPVQEVPLPPLSDRQQTVLNWVRSILEADQRQRSPRHLVVNALAGSGKTSTLVACAMMLARLFPAVRAAYLAFNRNAMLTIRDRMNAAGVRGLEVLTTHSFGSRAVRRVFPNIGEPNNRKVFNHLERFLPVAGAESALDASAHRLLWGPVKKLVGLVRNTLETNVRSLLAQFSSIEVTPDQIDLVVETVPKVVKAMTEDTSCMDFDDMLWLPLQHGIQPGKYDLIFVDEAQDLNRAQIELILPCAPHIVCVGDRWQSIYGFRGADVNAIPRISERLHADELPLDICYRCDSSIIAEAQRLVPEIKARETAPEGAVLEMKVREAVALVNDGDAILSRVNAPLMSICLYLLSQGRKAKIAGRDIGDNLIRFIDDLYEGDSLTGFFEALADYEATEIPKLVAADRSTVEVEDRIACLMALSTGLKTVRDLRTRIESLFADEVREGVTLSSIHKAKGMEWPTVVIVRPDLLPHPKATTPTDAQQEKNLEYVAITRAKQRLVFAHGEVKRENLERKDPANSVHSQHGVNESTESMPDTPAPVSADDRVEALFRGTPAYEEARTQEQAAPVVQATALEPKLQPIVIPEGMSLPSAPETGNGSFDGTISMEDWHTIRDAYLAVGVPAEITVPDRWRQYALVVNRHVRISTTIDTRGDTKRGNGDNAIDFTAFHPDLKGLTVMPKVLRTEGWKGRVFARINTLLKGGGVSRKATK